MEAIIAIIVIALVIWVIVKVVLPIAGVLAGIVLGAGALYAFIVSLISFFSSVSEHKDPYLTYEDNHPAATAGVRRGYFFGPGFHQINEIVSGAFEHQKQHMDKIGAWRENFVDEHAGMWLLNIWVHLFYFSAFLFVYIFGSVWVSAFSVILCGVILTGMTIFFVLFSILWISDRIYLLAHSIQSRCPNCKRTSVVPLFECPSCGQLHPKLTPGPYGTFHRKCSCGESLPTTVFNGRSSLKAYCPYDQTELASGGARQFGIQLVGNTSSGKTTFLAAFWHQYLESAKQDYSTAYKCFPQEAFDELEEWFQYGLSSSTSDMNSQMYSVLHERPGELPYQMTIYDVAGEAFENLDASIQQQQFKYCEGLIIVIDPTAAAAEADNCITSFANEYKKLKGKHSTALSDTPVAVIISKSDLYKKEIGLPKIQIRSRQREIPENMSADDVYSMTRDEMCRGFLEDHGFDTTLNLLDSEFSRVSFFSVSAMGHEPVEDTPYSPWGVQAPVDWILAQSNALIVR